MTILGIVIAVAVSIFAVIGLLSVMTPVDPIEQIEINKQQRLAEIDLETAAQIAQAEADVEVAKKEAEAAKIRAQIPITQSAPVTNSTSVSVTGVISTPVASTPEVTNSQTVSQTPVITTTEPVIEITCTFTDEKPKPFQDFLTAWAKFQHELGCPAGKTLIDRGFALQEFSTGKIIWIEVDSNEGENDRNNMDGDQDLLFAFQHNGQWKSYPDGWMDGYHRCDETSSFDKGLDGGIAKVWCEGARALVNDPIDIPAGGENFKGGVIQCFDKGCLVWEPINQKILVLHSAGAASQVIDR